MPTLDIFDDDAFSLTSLTTSINRMPFVPNKIGSLGIFEEQGIYTDKLFVEEYNGILSLIPTSRRGSPGEQNARARRKVYPFETMHLVVKDAVRADEIFGVRQFGQEDALETAKAEVNRRMLMMNAKHDATVEFGRVNALKGLILDADGASVLYNLFTVFGVTQDETDFELGTTGVPLLGKIENVKNNIENELGMMTYDSAIGILGNALWQEFITNSQVQTAYQYFQAVGQKYNPLRNDMRYVGFDYGGVTWYKYRGNVGGIPFVADSEGYVFPTGVPELYKTFYAPGDWMDTVGTLGLPRYAQIYPTIDNKSRELETQSNPLSVCMRPKVLQKIISST